MLKILRRGLMLLLMVTMKKLLELFKKKELQKPNQKEFRVKKLIKRKRNKLYVKCRGYDSSFNNWIDRKDII